MMLFSSRAAAGTCALAGVLLLPVGGILGCQSMQWLVPPPALTAAPQPAPPAALPPASPTTPTTAETPAPLALVRAPEQWGAEARTTRLDVRFTVLYVQVPRVARAQTEPLWNHLREDVLDTATVLRLRQNGLRVGLNRTEWWDAVKATLDGIDGVRSLALDPVRIPPQYPLALELDREPHDQTLFFMSDDGVLTGETWPHSRNVLRLSYDLDLADADRVHVTLVPEVRQRLEGWRWVRSAAGLTQTPEYNGRTFTAAGFQLPMAPGEFVLVAPSPQAELYGIIGGAFLAREEDGCAYDSYVFLRADVNHVAYRN